MKALVIDDEVLPGKFLQALILKHCFEVTSVEVFTSAMKAIEHLQDHSYDLLFLDVEMPEMNSFDFLKRALLPKKTQLIFVTAHSHYAIDAFKVEAVHYLLKPVDPNELMLAVRRANRNWDAREEGAQGNSTQRLSIYDGDKYIIVDKQDIIRMEADGSYTKIVLEGNENIFASRRLGYYEKKLQHEVFFRCHHSHVVNIEKIHSIERGKASFVLLKNEEEIPLSSSKRDSLKTLLGFE